MYIVAGVNYWRAGREPLEQQRDGAINYATATIADQTAQARAITEMYEHFTRQIDQFESRVDVAMREVFRDHGWDYEQYIGMPRPEAPHNNRHRAPLYGETEKQARRRDDGNINRDGGQVAGFANGMEYALPTYRMLKRKDPEKPGQPVAQLKVTAPTPDGDTPFIRRKDVGQAILKPQLDVVTRNLQAGEKYKVPGRYARKVDDEQRGRRR